MAFPKGTYQREILVDTLISLKNLLKHEKKVHRLEKHLEKEKNLRKVKELECELLRKELEVYKRMDEASSDDEDESEATDGSENESDVLDESEVEEEEEASGSEPLALPNATDSESSDDSSEDDDKNDTQQQDPRYNRTYDQKQHQRYDQWVKKKNKVYSVKWDKEEKAYFVTCKDCPDAKLYCFIRKDTGTLDPSYLTHHLKSKGHLNRSKQNEKKRKK